MLQHSTRYGISTTVALTFDQAVARTREAQQRGSISGSCYPATIIVYADDDRRHTVVAAITRTEGLGVVRTPSRP